MRDDDLGFWIDLCDAKGNMIERLANLAHFDFARAVYPMCVKHYPDQRIIWRQRARVIRDSGRG